MARAEVHIQKSKALLEQRTNVPTATRRFAKRSFVFLFTEHNAAC